MGALAKSTPDTGTWAPLTLPSGKLDNGWLDLDSLFSEIDDDSLFIVDAADASKRLRFDVDAGMTAAKTITINLGAQTDDRTLAVPVLGGNRTLALIDQAQTFSGTQTFSGAIALTAGPGVVLTVASTSSSAVTIALNSIYTAGGIGAEANIITGGSLRSVSAATSGQVNFLVFTNSTSDSLSFKYTETAVGAVSADVWQLRIGGSTARPIQLSNGDATLMWTIGTTGILTIHDTTNSTTSANGCLILSGGVGIADAKNISVGTTTGTKLGTAVTQKLGFWNATPVVQPSGAAQAAVATTAATNITPYGYTTQAQADGIITLLNEIRSVLVNTGIMKGAA